MGFFFLLIKTCVAFPWPLKSLFLRFLIRNLQKETVSLFSQLSVSLQTWSLEEFRCLKLSSSRRDWEGVIFPGFSEQGLIQERVLPSIP